MGEGRVVTGSTRTALAPTLVAAYRATNYHVGKGALRFVLRIDEQSRELLALHAKHGVRSSAFLTAFNSRGKAWVEKRNLAANSRLQSDLRRMGLPTVAGKGADPLGEWPPEQSVLALGCDRRASMQLGRKYRQNAILWAGKSAVPMLLILR